MVTLFIRHYFHISHFTPRTHTLVSQPELVPSCISVIDYIVKMTSEDFSINLIVISLQCLPCCYADCFVRCNGFFFLAVRSSFKSNQYFIYLFGEQPHHTPDNVQSMLQNKPLQSDTRYGKKKERLTLVHTFCHFGISEEQMRSGTRMFKNNSFLPHLEFREIRENHSQ